MERRAGPQYADGLVGDVFRIAFEPRATFQSDRPEALPWLYGIAGNLLRQDRRAQTRHLRALRRLHNQRMADPNPDDEVVDRVAAEGLWPAVYLALMVLRPEEREIVLLVAWEQLTYEDVATALSIPVGTVRSRLHRARRKLRERLPDFGEEQIDPRISPTRTS